jgi:phosphopantetheinyl transferase
LDFIPEDGSYQCGNYWFSTSYSVDQIFFALDQEKVVVDMEKMIARDENLLPKMTKIVDGKRGNFYLQWCSKECLVKWLDLPLDAVQDILLQNVVWSGDA